MTLKNNLYTIINYNPTGEECEFTISFLSDCLIYKAHFPGEPITPGVCLLQVAEELLNQHLHADLSLCKIKNVKFISVVIPQEDKPYKVTISALKRDAETYSAQVSFTSDDKVYAKMSIVLA